jgi:CRISPR system Cascade subunit CasE
MFLLRAFLSSKSSAVRADLANPDGLHKTVMRAFTDLRGSLARTEQAILHRLDVDRDGRLVLLVQSDLRPDPSRWPRDYVADFGNDVDVAFSHLENPAIRDVTQERASLSEGSRFLFRLRANTTKRVSSKSKSANPGQVGKRVPVRGDEERRRWLTRHAEASGFAVDLQSLRITEVAAMTSRARGVTLAGATFEGVLTVVDVAAFRAALRSGLGPAKAYGFGLLSIVSAR